MSGRHTTQGVPSPVRRSRYEDPEASTNPAIRRIVSQLQALPSAPGPRPEFQAELRAQLVAVAPRLVAEGAADDVPDARVAGGSTGGRVWRAVRYGIRSRLVLILAGAVAVFVLLLGGAVWLSGSALPGDSLYGIKRAGENVTINIKSGTDKGKAYLDYATKRIEEVSKLVSRATSMPATSGPSAAPASVNPHIDTLVRSTLNDADNDTKSAAQLLNGEAVSQTSTVPLNILETWAGQQLGRIQTVVGRLDKRTPLGQRALQSWSVVNMAQKRADQLSSEIKQGPPCMPAPPTDAFGPLYCRISGSIVPLSPNSGTPRSVPSATPTPSKSPTFTPVTSTGVALPAPTAAVTPPADPPQVSDTVVPSIPLVLPTDVVTSDPPPASASDTPQPQPPPDTTTSDTPPPTVTTPAPPPTSACAIPTDTAAPPDSGCSPSPAESVADSTATS
jgi:Domain of unknown function (DUF5667)